MIQSIADERGCKVIESHRPMGIFEITTVSKSDWTCDEPGQVKSLTVVNFFFSDGTGRAYHLAEFGNQVQPWMIPGNRASLL